MELLLALTAWEMEKPKAYEGFHLTFLIGGLLICVLLAWLLRKASERTNNILLFFIGFFLLGCEVYKQLFYTYYIGHGSYQWWIFPFQLCSVPMYLCLILPFIKNQRIKQALYTFLATYNLVGGFISLFEPSGLCHEYVTLTLHAFIWHLMLVFLGFYLIGSGRAARKFKEFLPAIGVFVCMCAIAQIINIVFRDKEIKMFYISPYYSTPLAVFKNIEAATNWFVNMVVYLFALCLGAFAFFVIGMYLRKLYRLIIEKIKAKKAI